MRDTIDMAREIADQYSKAERFQTWTHDFMMQRLMELVAVSAAAEREACAKVCDELAGILACHNDKDGSDICVSLRDAIRERSANAGARGTSD
jgi:hypothetical protein